MDPQLRVRYETQNAISDHADVAPRIGSLGAGRGGKNKSPRLFARRLGMFYDRFTSDLVMQAERVNGLNQSN